MFGVFLFVGTLWFISLQNPRELMNPMEKILQSYVPNMKLQLRMPPVMSHENLPAAQRLHEHANTCTTEPESLTFLVSHI